MTRAFNEATEAYPCWDDYKNSGGRKLVKDCGEKPRHWLATEDASKVF
eukprot:gene5857-6149_t